LLFLEHGAKVAAFDIRASDHSTSTESTLLHVECDVSSEKAVDTAVTQVTAEWGQVDILVNCAGVMDNFARIGDVPNEVWNRCFAINVNGPMNLIRRCIPELLKTKGAIVNVCSTASIRGSAAGVAYTASKHALLGISRSTAWAYAKEGIRCNSILPGATAGTDIMKNNPAGIDQAGYGVSAPYQACTPGYCTPENMANGVLFLATGPAVNGAELAVDMGWTTS